VSLDPESLLSVQATNQLLGQRHSGALLAMPEDDEDEEGDEDEEEDEDDEEDDEDEDDGDEEDEDE